MRCKECREPFEVKYFLQKYCLLNDRCIAAHVKQSRNQTVKDWNKRKKVLKDEMITVQELTKIAQVVFNTYIRQRDKLEPCISCQNPKPKKVNAGHYYSSGGHKNITFNLDNLHLQCEYCNTYLHGNLIEYRKHLIKKIGIDRVEWLDKNAHVTRKYTRKELKDLIVEYKEKIKKLKNKCK